MTEDEVLAAVRAVVAEADPQGLLLLGAPEDEYEPEVADLTALVLGSVEPTVAAVVAIWERWFSGVSRLRGEAALALTTRLVEIRQARLSS